MAGLVKPIPLKKREEMAHDPFYKKCCIRDEECSGRIQWHHHFKFRGHRMNEGFGILPVCEFHHEHENRKDIREKLDYVMLNRMTDEELKKYSVAEDYKAKRDRLHEIYNIRG